MISSIKELLTKSLQALKPPPRMTVSEWADTYRILSSEASAEPGKYKSSRTPYLREIMDTINDHKVKIVVFMKSSQVGATESIINIIRLFCSLRSRPYNGYSANRFHGRGILKR